MQMHKSFIIDSALAKGSTQTILFPWKYQATENRNELLMLFFFSFFYPHAQKRHLIICSKAEERQVPNHSCHFAEWLRVCVRRIFLLGRGGRMGILSQLSLAGVNTLSTSLYTVSTSLLSVWWKQKWQDDDCHPRALVWFMDRRFFYRGFHHCTWINSQHPSCFIFCADTWIPLN